MKPDPLIANCQQVIGDPRFQDCSNLLQDGRKGTMFSYHFPSFIQSSARIWGAGKPDFGWAPSCKLVYNPHFFFVLPQSLVVGVIPNLSQMG
jgi:hypothetical protein